MKSLLFLSLNFLALTSQAAINCSASYNGDALMLEKSAEGSLTIAVEDRHFDVVDVILDIKNPQNLKLQMAHFISTDFAKKLKESIKTLDVETQAELLKLAKARIVNGNFSFAFDGTASLRLAQDADVLTVTCFNIKEEKN
jgi:hypothetical protein